MPDRYVAIQPHVTNGPGLSWETTWSWSAQLHDDRAAALSQGFETFGCDDFNVGVVDADTGLVRSVLWMDRDDRGQSEAELREVNEQLGFLRGARPC